MKIEDVIKEHNLTEDELEIIKKEIHKDPEYLSMFQGNYAENYENMIIKHTLTYVYNRDN